MSVYGYSYRGLSSFPGLVDQPSSTPSKSPNPAKNKDSASAPAARGLNPAPTQSKDAVSQRGKKGKDTASTGKDSKGDIGDIGATVSDAVSSANYGMIGTALGLATGIPGLGFVGSAIDTVNDVQDATDFDPSQDVDAVEAFGHHASFGFFGDTALGQAVDGYQNETDTDLNDAALEAFADDDDYSGPKGVVGNEGRAEGAGEGGASSSSTAGGYGGSSGLGGPAGGFEGTAAASGEGGGGGKMACTAMNTEYGFGSFRQSIWLRQSKDLHPAYQRGYHAIFGPLVKRAYQDDGSPRLRAVLEHIARRRTADIWKQRRGRRDPIGMIERAILEPLCYIVGRLS